MVNNATAQFEVKKEQYVTEIFIDTGDEDYITARWLFLNGLSRQFFWSAAQSLEKYLKAALLLNGHPVKEGYGHNITKLFSKASSFVGDLIPENLEVPKQVKLFSTYKNFWGDSSTREFVSHIHKHGDPNNRYDYFGIKQGAGDLYKLDQVVFALRNIAIKLDRVVDPVDSTKTYADRIREYPGQQLRAFGEHLVEKDKAKLSVYMAACENNFPFAPKAFEHRELSLNDKGTVSSLEILFKNNITNSHALRTWVIENIPNIDKELKKLQRR